MNLRSPRYALALTIMVCLGVYLLAACAMTPTRTEVIVFKGCDGKYSAAEIAVYVGFPPVQCPLRAAQAGLYADAAMYAIGGALGCAFWTPPDADRIVRGEVYVLPGEWLLGHEMAHIRGMRHPALMPWSEQECER